MTRDEPSVVGRRLASRLGATVHRWPDGRDADGDVLLVTAAQLADVSDARLAAAAAVLVTGEPTAAASSGLVALRERLEERGLAVALSTFATVADARNGMSEVPLALAAPVGDTRVPALLAAGPHALTLDPAVDVEAVGDDDPPARVCVVSFEVSGMTGGGIGTASTSLAETLARAGHDVTLLFTGWQEPDRAAGNERWQRHYAERGVRLEIVRPPDVNTVKNPYFPARSAYEVYCWLRREQAFDVVHLPENMGHGAYAQMAKRQGVHFAGTTFVIGTHGPTRWAAEANRVALTREEFLVNDALERISVAHSDVLLGPSRYLHDYKRARGWTLPERTAVQAYAVPAAVRRDAAAAAAPARDSDLPREIVFFGRLETRKGVATLCDALDLLAADPQPPAIEVTFLGPVAEVLGQSADAYIEGRARRWPWRWQLVSDRDQQGAAEYLARPRVLAVMPSTVDNAPNTVSEAVALGIPLVAGRTGGTGELVAAEQRDDHMFGDPPGGPLLPLTLEQIVPAPDPRPLAELLRRRVTTPVEPARTPAASEAVDRAYDRWHRAVRRQRELDERRTRRGRARRLPTLAACVLFDGDEALLSAQLDALASDDGVEVVVADLRADPTSAVSATRERSIRVVRPERPGHAAQARTAALEATSGELVAFVPAADVPLPAFARTMRAAAAASGAAALGCAVLDERETTERDAPEDAMVRAFVPLPGPPLAGLTHPAFSAGPYAVRRRAIRDVGGFAADARADEADHELLNRIAAAGLAIEVVPEPLAGKRRDDRWSKLRSVWPHDLVDPPYDAEQWLRVERPFAAAGVAADLIGLLRGARGEAVDQRTQVREQHAAYEARVAEQQGWIDGLETRAAEQRTYQAELEAEVQRLTGEIGRLRSLTEEMEQTAAQLTVRTLRNAGRKVGRRLRR